MNAWEIMPVFLLLLFSIALSIGMGIVVLVVKRSRPLKASQKTNVLSPNMSGTSTPGFMPRPTCWLAIKAKRLSAVQTALGLHNPKPCSLLRGFAGEEKVFIAPPVRGWILVVGSDLPDPCQDPDVCFRFVLQLSRKLGQVQLFSASRILHHHAWVQADRGKIVRAYAWAGQTVWNQGKPSSAEKELDLKCLDYTQSLEHPGFGVPDALGMNAEKVPLLAARWSLDPLRIEDRFLGSEAGVAGEPSQYY